MNQESKPSASETITATQQALLYSPDDIAGDANTITIAYTNLRTSDGNALSLTQYDTALLLFEGTDWVVLATSANQ